MADQVQFSELFRGGNFYNKIDLLHGMKSKICFEEKGVKRKIEEEAMENKRQKIEDPTP